MLANQACEQDIKASKLFLPPRIIQGEPLTLQTTTKEKFVPTNSMAIAHDPPHDAK
jgi:hypothetical protein